MIKNDLSVLFGEIEQYPLREKGLLWLKASAYYELTSATLISDGEWDSLTKYLLDNYNNFDVYLKWAIPYDCLISSTASGIKWNKGLPKIVIDSLKIVYNKK